MAGPHSVCADCDRVAQHICLRCGRQLCDTHVAAPDACNQCEAAFAQLIERDSRNKRLSALALGAAMAVAIGAGVTPVAGLILGACGVALSRFARSSKGEVAALRGQFFPRAELPEARVVLRDDHPR